MNLESVTIPRAGAREAAAEYRRAAKSLPEGSEQRREFEQIARAYRVAAKEEVPLIALTPTIAAGGTRQGTVVFGKGQSWERREQNLLPNLAACRASAAFCYTRGVRADGSLELVGLTAAAAELSQRRRRARSGNV